MLAVLFKYVYVYSFMRKLLQVELPDVRCLLGRFPMAGI